MYVHSYQSLVWNRVASHRIRRHSLRPIPGDLVPGNGNGPQAITEETLNQYTIHDVLLPLPGYDIALPQNDGERERGGEKEMGGRGRERELVCSCS